MNTMPSHSRFINVAILVLSLLLVGMMITPSVNAEPKKAFGAIGSRVKSQTELCETLGGGQLDVSYSYENGKEVGATTHCKGGKHDGYNCSNALTTTDCWQSPKSAPTQTPVIVHDRPEIAEPMTDVQVVQATPEAGPSLGGASVDGSTGGSSPITSIDHVTPDAPILVELVPQTPVSAP